MTQNIRQLAAIMFTDMVGYTALMQADEERAKRLRDRHRSVLERFIRKYHGLLLQYYGDGSLSVFGSAIEAVECAVQIQMEMLREPVIPSRIGLNVGDIVYDDDGIYGDGVNVASRIESMSVPGAVLVSDKIYDEIKNHPEFPAITLGTHKLKNVKRPVEIYALGYKGLVIPSRRELKGKTEISNKSIAVLPFVNISSNKENEYFTDGISEEIINALTRIEGLQVTSRTSAFSFKGKNIDVRVIGSQLNVNTVLEGSVRQAGNKIRVTAQLINASDGYHLWAEVYDRDLEDIFELQDEISRKIANNLREKLSISDKKDTMVVAPTENLEAYNDYLQGQFHWNKWTPPETEIAIKYFNKAIKRQPDFALSYSGLAACYCFLGAIGYLPSDKAYPKAKQYANKALALNPSHADAHLSEAMIHYFYDWDWTAADRSFQKAFGLNPGSADAYRYYAMFLMTVGNYKESLQSAEHAKLLDPLSLPVNHILANAYVNNLQFEKAIEQYQIVLELEPNFSTSIYGLGLAYLEIGENEKAMHTFEEMYKRHGRKLEGTTQLTYVYARLGKKDLANKFLGKMKARQKANPKLCLETDFAIVYSGFGDYDKAFYYLEKALEKRLGSMVFLTGVHWRDLHKDKRFKNILTRMNLPYKRY